MAALWSTLTRSLDSWDSTGQQAGAGGLKRQSSLSAESQGVFTQHLKTSTVNTSTDHLKAFLQVVSEIVQTTNVRAQTTAETLKTMLVEDAHLTKVNIRQLMTFFKV